MKVYVVLYGVHYETHLGGVHKTREEAEAEIRILKATFTQGWNSGEVIEKDLQGR